jgi:hypothetical protein
MGTKSVLRTKNKKALSTVVATLLIILLTMVSAAILWTAIKAFLKTNIDKTDCFDVESSDKVILNGRYTCYNSTFHEVQFSVTLGDVDIDSLIVSITMEGVSRSFTLTNDYAANPYLRPYKGNFNDPVKLPDKNGGLTYSASGDFTGAKIDSIQIAPVVDGKQCGATSQIYQIEDCMAFAD